MEYLDDGESWLPSDIFPTEEHVHQQPPHQHHLNRPAATSIEDLSRQFGSMNLLDHQLHHPVLTPTLPSSTQQLGVFEGMTQCGVTTPTPNGCYGLTVGPMGVDHGLFNYNSGPVYHTPDLPALHFPMHKPVYHQVAEQLMETRLARSSRPVHSQQQNQPLPFQASGCGFGVGVVRNCHSSGSTSSGTGVFIPRTISSEYRKKKPGAKNEVTQKVAARRPRKLVVGKTVCCRSVPSSEAVLPKDWNY